VLVRALRQRPAWELACFGLIVVVAAWLRLRHLDLMEFKTDEASAVEIGRGILRGSLPTTGLTSSVGAQNPPLFVYLIALTLEVWNDPRSAAGFVALMAVAAVALTYLVLRPRFGALAALTAAALLATAPWAVLFGRKIWAQDLLPIVTVSLLWSLFVLIERSRSRWVVFVPVLLSLTIQLNFSALALTIPVVAVVLYRLRHIHWWGLLAGVGISLLLLAPWLAHNANNHFNDIVTLAKEGRGHGSQATPGEGAAEAVRLTLHLAGTGGWSFVTGPSQQLFTHEYGWAWTLGQVAAVASVALIALGLVTCAIQMIRHARLQRGWPPVELGLDSARRALLVIWLVGIWLSYLASVKSKVLPHYLIPTYPVTFALAGVGLSDACRAHRRAELVALAGAAAVAAAFIAFTVGFQEFVGRHGGTGGDYGVAYNQELAAAKAVRQAGLHIDNLPVEFLANGSRYAPADVQLIRVRYLLDHPLSLPCAGTWRTFGALQVCFPD
jgi:4-amino-4-deoxy-L-arabinose transferase-like glycosyltransferase